MPLQPESRAKQLGYKRLVLDTTTKQVGAQRLYEKNDFTKYGMTKAGPFDVILYRKEL